MKYIDQTLTNLICDKLVKNVIPKKIMRNIDKVSFYKYCIGSKYCFILMYRAK